MKKFKFRLQRVLEYRNVLKKDKERELALKNRELFSAESTLSEILAAQDAAPPPEELVTMAELKLKGEYQAHLRDALINQRLVVLEAADAVDQAREAYIEKAVESETLETLKQRHKDEHKLEQDRKERKAMSEMVTLRHRLK